MNLIVFGINHKTAPVEIREKLSIPEHKLEEHLALMNSKTPGLVEKVILSTCNRVEIYARANDIEKGVDQIKRFLSDYHEISMDDLEKSTYVYLLEDAVEHLFKVASSLDSMVVGEPQILGQVKDAYRNAKELRATGTILNNLFERSFSVAKRVRTETAISENAVSVSYAAVELARKIFGDLNGKTVMLIGAGEMIELAARNLLSQGVKTVLVSNRTYKRAVELATELNGEAIKFDDLHDELKRCDIVISSTGAPHFVVRSDLAMKVIGERNHRPMFFIDIAVPRDIEPSVNDIDNCYLYDIDDLKNVVEANLAEREKEAGKAEEIVKNEVGEFLVWVDRLEAAPIISAIKEQAERTRQAEIKKSIKRLGEITKEQEEAIERLTSSIVNKILHQPIINIKKEAETENGPSALGLVRRLFGL